MYGAYRRVVRPLHSYVAGLMKIYSLAYLLLPLNIFAID